METTLALVCRRLSIAVDFDYEAEILVWGRIKADARIREFGRSNGTLLFQNDDLPFKCQKELAEAGFGFSVGGLSYLSPDTELSEKTIDIYKTMFREWGWSGAEGAEPDWYYLSGDEKGVYRAMSVHEKGLLSKMLSVPFAGRELLWAALETAQVSQTDDIGSLLVKLFVSSTHPTILPILISAAATDTDGVCVDYYLQLENDKPSFLEINKDDGSLLRGPIDLKSMEITVNN